MSPADDNATPTFERILTVFEASRDAAPFDPAHVLVLTRLHAASKDHFGKVLDGLIGAPPESGEQLRIALLQGAQRLHRRIANALAQSATRILARPQPEEQKARAAELALLSFQARGEEIKWHAFEHTNAPPASWQQNNQLLRALEVAGMDRRAVAGDVTCLDGFAQCLLLATLNVGILTPPQLELAHRWLAVQARAVRLEPFFDPEAHWYQVDLARAAGPERVSPASAVADTTRFLAVFPLGSELGKARSQLYAGELSVGAMPSSVVALHFGSFLDLAERLWSQDFRRTSWRSERNNADGETIDVVMGLDQVIGILAAEDDDPAAPARARWALRDKSTTGLGARLPVDSGAAIPLGALVGFRDGAQSWQLGSIVRRVRVPDSDQWSIGIKRLSDAPVVIDLEVAAEGEQRSAGAPPAIYAPMATETGRLDSVVIDASSFAGASEFFLPTGGGAFRIRANRVIDRGDRWIRIGFEVLGKK